MPIITAIFFALLALMPLKAQAVKVCLFSSERLHYVQDVEQAAPDGKKLALARKYTEYCLLLPLHFRDDGYVLMEAGNYSKYYLLPKESVIELQASNALPNPLPDWRPSLIFILFYGYAFWFLLAAVTLYVVHGLRKLERQNSRT